MKIVLWAWNFKKLQIIFRWDQNCAIACWIAKPRRAWENVSTKKGNWSQNNTSGVMAYFSREEGPNIWKKKQWQFSIFNWLKDQFAATTLNIRKRRNSAIEHKEKRPPLSSIRITVRCHICLGRKSNHKIIFSVTQLEIFLIKLITDWTFPS